MLRTVWGSGFRASGFRAQGLGFDVSRVGLRYMVKGQGIWKLFENGTSALWELGPRELNILSPTTKLQTHMPKSPG